MDGDRVRVKKTESRTSVTVAWTLETFPRLTLVPVGFWCSNLLSRASPLTLPLHSCIPASRTFALYGDGMNVRPQANSGAFPVYLYSFCKSSFFLSESLSPH